MAGLTVLVWILSFGILDIDLEAAIVRLSLPLHHLCLNAVPAASPWRHLYEAIVCGAAPPPSPERFWFQATGLYHLLVVSGSHLILLGQWVSTLATGPRRTPFVLGTLALYCMTCLLAPPVVRAFAQILLIRLSISLRLNMSPPQICLATGTLCLAGFPGWSDSLSFWLSWLASLLCSLASETRLTSLTRVTLVQCLLIPGFGFAGANVGLSVICNWLLGPVLGHALFGCALLATFFHILAPACDHLWGLLVLVLEFATESFGQITLFSAKTSLLLAYVSALNFTWLGVHRWINGRHR